MPFDANDEETKTAIKEAVEAAVAEAKEGLETKNKDLLRKLAKAKEGASIDPSELAAIEAENEKLKTDLAAATKAAKDAATAAEKTAKTLEAETAFTQRLLIQDGIKSALLANGVKDEDFIDSLAAKFAPTATITVEGDKREAKIGDKSLADHIKEWAGTDAGKKFVSAPVNGGGGAPGGKGTGEGGKVVSQEQFDAMKPKERSAHMTAGGTISATA